MTDEEERPTAAGESIPSSVDPDAPATFDGKDDVEKIVGRIRRFATTVDDPEKWRIVVPVGPYDDVKERLETTYDLGSYYEGISLCWSDTVDETVVKYRSELADELLEWSQ